MGGAAFKSLASARILAGVMAAVIASFVVSTVTEQYVESKSAAKINAIVGNAMPSVQDLALVRGELREIDRTISRRPRSDSDVKPSRAIAENRRNMNVALAAYTALPFFPGEQRIYAAIPEELDELDRELANVDAGLDDDSRSRARDTIDALDAGLQRLETYDASQGQRLGLEIAQNRVRSRSVILLLDTASVLLALGAMSLALRQRSRAAHVVEQEIAATERQLDDLRVQVDELGQFAGRVAHDIRGPLQTAVLALDVVRQGDRAVAERATTRALNALKRMGVLVDGLLEFARAGGKPPSGTSTDAQIVINELVAGLASEASAREIALSAHVPMHAHVACSTGVLTSIVSNLARNAIHHMGSAPIRQVEIGAKDVGARWRIEVRDTGPGIPPGEERRIFQPHVQLGSAQGGIGLGLATVERLVHAHGGDVGVVSPVEGGALFWIELPKPGSAAK